MGDTAVVNPNTLPKLLEVINLVLESKRSRSKPFRDAYTFDVISSVRKKPYTLRRKSVSLVNECLLNHRFEEAAKLLWVMCQDRSCFDLALYRGIMVVLENLRPSNANEIVEKLSSAVKGLRYANKWDVQLEYLIYALKNGIEIPFELDKDKPGSGYHRPIPLLYQNSIAYSALLNYKKWVNISQGDLFSLNHKDFAFSVIGSLKTLIEEPGRWDIFVEKLIEMLEYYEEFEELEKILKQYVEHNPEDVNAYKYICVHLHKHKPDSEIFNDYAKVLANLCPSDEIVLLLVQRWKESGKKLKKRLKMLFNFLEYPGNRKNILGWEMLSSNLHEAVLGKESSSLDIVKSLWRLRSYSWNNNLFVSSNINSGEENFKLVLYKVKVLVIFEPNHKYIQDAEQIFPAISELKSTNDSQVLKVSNHCIN